MSQNFFKIQRNGQGPRWPIWLRSGKQRRWCAAEELPGKGTAGKRSTCLTHWAEGPIPGGWCPMELPCFSSLVFSCVWEMSGRFWEETGFSRGVVTCSEYLNSQHQPPTLGPGETGSSSKGGEQAGSPPTLTVLLSFSPWFPTARFVLYLYLL